MEGAVSKGRKICAHPVISEELRNAWPEAVSLQNHSSIVARSATPPPDLGFVARNMAQGIMLVQYECDIARFFECIEIVNLRAEHPSTVPGTKPFGLRQAPNLEPVQRQCDGRSPKMVFDRTRRRKREATGSLVRWHRRVQNVDTEDAIRDRSETNEQSQSWPSKDLPSASVV